MPPATSTGLVLLLACAASGICAYELGGYAFDVMRVRGARVSRWGERMAEAGHGKVSGPIAILVGIAHTLDAPKGGGGKEGPAAGDTRLVEEAGLGAYLAPEKLPALRMRVSVLSGAALALLFLGGGSALALLGLFLGLFGGRRLVDSMLRYRAADIRGRCEEELPGMLDIVALGVRAGMSFDAAVSTYCEGTDGVLAQLCAQAQAEYFHGAKSRARAFRDLADRLSLPAFSRFVGTVLQSLHFGAPLAPALHMLGEEVRSAHRAEVSERIAKAPVKMLVPMALLILPAMLLLVLGPVVMNVLSEMG